MHESRHLVARLLPPGKVKDGLHPPPCRFLKHGDKILVSALYKIMDSGNVLGSTLCGKLLNSPDKPQCSGVFVDCVSSIDYNHMGLP